MKFQNLTVLVADDDVFVRELLAEMLKAEGHQVETAENGANAVQKIFIEKLPDVVISDMDMPEMNGLELIRTIRKRYEYLPIIILTGNNEIQTAIEAMRSGANDYLLKDENIHDTLLISIENVMEKFRLKMENIQLIEDLAKKNKELERLSLLDGLTGIANRRYFEKIMAQEWGRAVRERIPISMLMIDIDFFKKFNDNYGHPEGDICLKKVANALNRVMKRSGDFLARYGGEEFSAILPDTDIDGAEHLAEKMRVSVTNLAIQHKHSEIADIVTVSIGVSSLIPDRTSNPEDLISKADHALYDAKQEGRNCVRSDFK